MNRAEFEQGYTSRSGVTVEELKERGLAVRPCFCRSKICQGWQIVHLRDYCDGHQTDAWRCCDEMHVDSAAATAVDSP